MKLELKVLIYSMINNLVIAVAKIFGGVFFNLGSLFADGMHTFSDFITDIVCLIGTKISKKKPTKYHPFGFGRVEYLTNLFIGIILFALGLYIIIHSLGKEVIIPPVNVLWLLLLALVLKLVAIFIMHKIGNKINSQVLITSVSESKADLYSSIAVSIITILLQFSDDFPMLKHVDLIGSILIGLLVLKTAFEIIKENSLCLIGEVEEDKEKIKKVEDFISNVNGVKDQEIKLIKYGAYYKLQLTLELDSKLTLRQVTILKRKIKKQVIRHRSLKIKHITIYVTNNIEKEK